jgi:hypothetical protein
MKTLDLISNIMYLKSVPITISEVLMLTLGELAVLMHHAVPFHIKWHIIEAQIDPRKS